MNAIQTEQRKVLIATIEHFNSGNRAVGEFGCTYSHSANGGCAVGRLLPAEVAERLHGTVREVFDSYPDLVQSIAHLQVRFLRQLQVLHDNDDAWDDNGLTAYGRLQVDYITKTSGLDPIDFSQLKKANGALPTP